ncbi:hypothetical protein [Burkholderia oklahomensis]|uniref:Uncharacterized protein n=1 Tax=Burkholderia oklahomensis TaxID=342113 RepID=A0AAI8BAY3_9BURK|nr:hypothetical protein [Burkholderia oklahomensis]AIO68813.1 hypothetical protein DM82_5325 [Burkholderia oklahomensis]AOI39258.1 hypothetical protein WG70_06240 [Burkholderia oklahomensis EO147]KUY51748.1 hypothetical protein WG70_15795 [Burkholderia oklahomensis EO147]QPS40392.1 hypothetical protein I6G57_32110 [Burkholderia oklahomensis]
MIPCDVCQPLLAERHPASGVPLVAVGKPTRLRPLLRKPVEIGKYRCSACGANWIRETDASAPDQVHWLFLGNASSILEPTARKRWSSNGERAPAGEPQAQPADAERVA